MTAEYIYLLRIPKMALESVLPPSSYTQKCLGKEGQWSLRKLRKQLSGLQSKKKRPDFAGMPEHYLEKKIQRAGK